ncbi:MAG: C13 family peptidase [Lysobacterales bacterium]
MALLKGARAALRERFCYPAAPVVGVALALSITPVHAQLLNLVDRTGSCFSAPSLGLSHNVNPPALTDLARSADRFRIPSGPEWRMDRLQVRGTFDGSMLNEQGVTVRIYDDDASGVGPGTQICGDFQYSFSASDLGSHALSGDFDMDLLNGTASTCLLPAGDYWISTLFNGPVGSDPALGRFWYWDQSDVPPQGAWRMRATGDIDGSGINCTDWKRRDECSAVVQETGLCFGLAGDTKVTLTDPLADQFSSAGTSFLMDVSSAFSDPDGDTVTYEAVGLPNSLTLEPLTGQISGVLTVNDIPMSPYNVTVTAMDDEFSAQDDFSLVVADNEVADFRFRRLWPVLQQPWYFGSDAPDIAFYGETLLVANATFSRIQRFSPVGLHITNMFIEGPGGPGTVGKPRVIAATRKAVYTVGDLDPQVHRLDQNGNLLGKFGQDQFNGEVPQYLAATERGCRRQGGCVYVGLSDRVLKFTEDGQFLTEFGLCSSQTCSDGLVQSLGGIKVSENGFVYLTDRAEDQLIILRNPAGGAISDAPAFVAEIGSSGTANGEFQQPGDVALDRDGRVYVVDFTRVQVFSPGGEFLQEYLPQNAIRAIRRFELGPTNLGFASNDLAQVARFRRVGDVDAGASALNFSTPFSSADDSDGFFRRPIDLAAGPNSNMYVADAGNFRVQKFDPQGQLLDALGGPGVGEGEFDRMIAIDARVVNGAFQIHVLDEAAGQYRIQRFDNQGGFISQIFLPSQAGYVDFVLGGSGFVFLVTNDGMAIKLDIDGEVVETWESEGINGEFRQIAFAPNGLLYFTVEGVSQEGFEIYNRFGDFVAFLPATFNAPASLTIADDGKIVLGEIPDLAPDVPRIKIYRQDGQLLQSVGQFGYFPGSFAAPAGLDFAPNGLLYISDSANNNVQVLDPVPPTDTTKVIVVAGGGPYPGNNLWETTQSLTNGAYLALAYQGLSGDDIMYLSSNLNEDLDGNGISDVDNPATPQALSNAISTWASGADRLVLFMADHGSENAFRLNPAATLNASNLATALNNAQTGPGGIGQVVVIYDACRSGSFIDELANPAVDRVVLTSSASDESSKYVSDGILSFSNQFWTQVFVGSDIAEAYSIASQVMTASFSDQTPQADADGDATSNEPVGDLDALTGIFVGAGTDFDPGSPVITSISEPQTLSQGNEAQISAFGVSDPDGVGRVYAEIIPPNYLDETLDQPVREFPGFELEPDSRGSVDYTLIYGGFSIEGVYTVNVYAQDRFGNVSAPSTTSVTVGNPELRKALIVVGGETTDGQWSAYSANGALAFAALQTQGYSDLGSETIRYLSNGGSDGVDFATNAATVADGFAWAGVQAQDVVVYLVGAVRSGGLRLASGEQLSAETLGGYLDAVESSISGKLVVLYEGSQSGAFLPELSTSSTDRRLLLASAAASQSASFELGGVLSFSQFFWNRVLNGDTVLDAFESARDGISFSTGSQTPQLDDNSNGEGNDAEDGFLAATYSIGTGVVQDANGPTLDTFSADEVLSGGGSQATVSVDNVLSTGVVQQVFGIVSTPRPQQRTESFVFSPVSVDGNGNGSYEGTFDGFGPVAGTYVVSIYARDDRGNIAFQDNVRVEQTHGRDGYEVDDDRDNASVIFVDDIDPQPHTFHVDNEQDFVSFNAVNSPAGSGNPAQTYEIAVENIDDFSGAGFSVSIELFSAATPLGTPLASTSGGIGGSLSLTWPSANGDYDNGEGEYFVRVAPSLSSQRGKYTVKIFRPDVLLTGTVKGSVVDALTGLPVAGALISSDGSVAAASSPSGSFQLVENPGSYDLTVTPPPGYEPLTESAVPVVESLTTWRLLQLQPSGVAPTVTTTAATEVAQETATLNGEVSPNGDVTAIVFEIAPAAGTTITQPSDLAGDAPLTDVFAAVAGLACATEYTFSVTAENANGLSEGADLNFTTAACQAPPVIGSLAATLITDQSVTLTAQIDPMGASTTAAFRWRPTGGVFNVYSSATPDLTGSGEQQATLAVGGLICATSYEFQVMASNSGGAQESAVVTFNTASCPQDPPTVTTLSATNISATSADLRASVQANGAISAIEYQVAPQGEAEGSWLSAGSTDTSITATAAATGLDCGRAYRYRFRATNSGGTATGTEQAFNTSECAADFPLATTQSASQVGQTGAVLNGVVNPSQSSTQVSFDFGPSEVYVQSASLDSPLDGAEDVAVSVTLSGLTCQREYHFRVQATNASGTAFGSDMTFTTNPCDRILLVDDDDNMPDVRSIYTDALSTLGFQAELWNTGAGDAEPSAADLSAYSAVIWFTGNSASSATGPSAQSETALASYLDGGGCLAVSSQNYYAVRASGGAPSNLMVSHMGVAGGAASVGIAEVSGTSSAFAGLPASGSYTLDYAASGLSNQSDTLLSDSSAEEAFAGADGSQSAGLLKVTASYRTAYLGFPLEAVPGAVEQAAVLSAILDYCRGADLIYANGFEND